MFGFNLLLIVREDKRLMKQATVQHLADLALEADRCRRQALRRGDVSMATHFTKIIRDLLGELK
jgi:hypothetical protein